MERDARENSMGNLSPPSEAESGQGELGGGRKDGEHVATAHVYAASLAQRRTPPRDDNAVWLSANSPLDARTTI